MLKIKLFSVMTAILAFCNVIVAQEYVIQIDVTANLRAAPSLNGRIVGKVSAGELLHVIGETDDWLEVARDGKAVWIADWLDHTVIDSDKPLEVTSRFADMSCDRGPQWRDSYYGGYWDFGVMECSLTFQPLPESVLPAHKKEIPVEGPSHPVYKLKLWLNKLKQDAPEWYAYVYNAADKIIAYEPGSSLDIVHGMAYAHKGNIYMSRHAASGDMNSVISVIIHEACHLYEIEAGLRLTSTEAEVLCHTIEMRAAEDMGHTWAMGSARGMIIYHMYYTDS